ncbi:MAG: hypothetical protein RIQ93_3249 [Verrucomicrobiota bacterium]
MERLNWAEVRKDAERLLGETTAGPDLQSLKAMDRRRAARQLMKGAWAMGDYAAARQALREMEKGRPSLPDKAPIASRYAEVMSQLERIHVLARAGEQGEARQRLSAVWPEVEAIFAFAPTAVQTHLEMGYALWVKSEVAGDLEGAARRALLERAEGYLRPLASEGKLTRYQREVILGGIEKTLAALAR